MAFVLVQAAVNSSVVKLTRAVTQALESERLRVEVGIDAEDVEDDTWRGPIVASANDHTIADDEEEL